MTDEGGVKRTAKSCGPDAAVLASSCAEVFCAATVAKEPFTGESAKYILPSCGEMDCFASLAMTVSCSNHQNGLLRNLDPFSP